MDQVQCPNCGGYKVYEMKGSQDEYSIFSDWLFWAGWVTMGFAWIFLLIKTVTKKNDKQPTSLIVKSKCIICGYEFEWEKGSPPVAKKVDKYLIAKAEEEEQRRRMFDD